MVGEIELKRENRGSQDREDINSRAQECDFGLGR